MSRIGVPSSKSQGPSNNRRPSMPKRRAGVIPMGLGRCGERVENTPRRCDGPRGGNTNGRQDSAR